MHVLIHDIALCTIAAWALGVLAQFFRQPVILAYLVGGFAIGPAGFALVEGQESVSTISELGLIFLLFMIGLEIDLKKIISAGSSILVTAASQILGGTVVGVGFFYLIGYPMAGGKWDALYLGIAAALSSTVIIVKMLYDKRELDTLPGRVTLGLLVLQDLVRHSLPGDPTESRRPSDRIFHIVVRSRGGSCRQFPCRQSLFVATVVSERCETSGTRSCRRAGMVLSGG